MGNGRFVAVCCCSCSCIVCVVECGLLIWGCFSLDSAYSGVDSAAEEVEPRTYTTCGWVGLCLGVGREWELAYMGGETVGLAWERNGMGLIVYCCCRLTGLLHAVMKWNVVMFWFLFGLDWSAKVGILLPRPGTSGTGSLAMCLGCFYVEGWNCS